MIIDLFNLEEVHHDHVGGKAYNIHKLQKAGLPVPRAVVIQPGVINIDGHNPDINQILRDLNRTTHKEDPFNDVMIARGGMAAFIANGKAFNANNGHVYEAMREYTTDKPVAIEPVFANSINFAPNAP